MKKILFLILLISAVILPVAASAISPGVNPDGQTGFVDNCDRSGIVTCCGPDCTISSFFAMLVKIYDFIVKMIATPLAVIALIVGGIMIMISAGNPNLAGKGKQILWAAIIGLALVWGSWLIIDFILKAIGYTQNWSSL